MPALIDSGPTDVKAFIDYLYGKENNGNAAIAATAKFAQHHVRNRPCVSFPGDARWQTIAGMKECARLTGPSVTTEQFDTALAAFVAS